MILVVDASKSMKADDGSGRPKMAAAKEALNTLVDELPDDAKVGLRVYGSEVRAPARRRAAPTRSSSRRWRRSTATGSRPRSTRSRRAASRRSGARCRARPRTSGTAKQKTVVLVSDGGDNCAPPAPCGVRAGPREGRRGAEDPGGRLPGRGAGAQAARVHRRGWRWALRRRRQRGGARRPAALADRAGAAAVRDRGQGAGRRAGAVGGEALRARAVRHDRPGQRARLVLVPRRRRAVDRDQRDAAGRRTRGSRRCSRPSCRTRASSSPTATARPTGRCADRDARPTRWADLRDPPVGRYSASSRWTRRRARAGRTRSSSRCG